MGTTTTNYNFYKPDIGETGWGATFNSQTLDAIDTQIKVNADAITAEDLWDRTGTTLEPANANDAIDLGSGNISTTGTITDGTLSTVGGVITGMVSLNAIVAADFVTLTDGSNADALHVHASITDDQVKIDAAATRGYIGATNADGVLRAGALLTYVDGGDFVTLNVDESALTHDNLIAGTIASHDTTGTGANLTTLTDGSNADALHVHAAASVTLQQAFDAGQTITIADNDNQTLLITNNDTTNNQDTVQIVNNAGGNGLYVNQAGVLSSGTDYGAYFYSNSAQVNGSALVRVEQDNATTTGWVMQIVQQNASCAADSLRIDQDGTGHCLHLSQDGVLGASKYGLYVVSSAAQVTSNLVNITNHASSTQPTMVITSPGTGSGINLYHTNVGAGNAFYIDSDGTDAAIYVDTDGLAPCVQLDNGANGSHIRFVGDPVVAAPVDGDLWWTGVALNFYDGASTTNLLTSSGVSDLQGAFDGGQTITIGDGDNQTLAITNNDTTNDPNTVTITNAGSTHNLSVLQTGVRTSSQFGLNVQDSAIQTTGLNAFIAMTNASSTGDNCWVSNTGTGNNLYVVQNTEQAASKYALYVTSTVAQTNSGLVRFYQANGSSTQVCTFIRNEGSGPALEVDNNGTRHGVYIHQDGTLDSSSYNALYVNQASVLPANGFGALFYSNAQNDNSGGALVGIRQDNASSTQLALFVDNDGSGTCISVKNDGNGAHFNLAGDPTVASPVDGDLWYTGSGLKFRDGTTTVELLPVSAVEFVIDGGGSAITTGIKGDLEIPFACTILQATLLLDQSATFTLDIWKDTYANFPPTVADTITAAAKPGTSAALKDQDSTLTGWTTSVTAGDIIRFNVDANDNATRATISLKVIKT